MAVADAPAGEAAQAPDDPGHGGADPALIAIAAVLSVSVVALAGAVVGLRRKVRRLRAVVPAAGGGADDLAAPHKSLPRERAPSVSAAESNDTATQQEQEPTPPAHTDVEDGEVEVELELDVKPRATPV